MFPEQYVATWSFIVTCSRADLKNRICSLNLILKGILAASLVKSKKKGEILSHLREKRYFSKTRKGCKGSNREEGNVLPVRN